MHCIEKNGFQVLNDKNGKLKQTDMKMHHRQVITIRSKDQGNYSLL